MTEPNNVKSGLLEVSQSTTASYQTKSKSEPCGSFKAADDIVSPSKELTEKIERLMCL